MKSFIKLGLWSLFLIISLSNHAQEIQSGIFKLNRDVREFNLSENEGPRGFGYEIKFKTPFEEKPEIMLSVTSVDANTRVGIRYRVETGFVTNEGFLIKVGTWGDSKIYALEGQWIAIEK
ncbi:MAG: H-type lectin domain-containing protein [Bacteroidota bacterium]